MPKKKKKNVSIMPSPPKNHIRLTHITPPHTDTYTHILSSAFLLISFLHTPHHFMDHWWLVQQYWQCARQRALMQVTSYPMWTCYTKYESWLCWSFGHCCEGCSRATALEHAHLFTSVHLVKIREANPQCCSALTWHETCNYWTPRGTRKAI